METDNEKENKENICKVYDTLLEQLQKEMPDSKVANAVVHFDETSSHIHVVGVPIGRGFKRGLETKVSKLSIFTPKTLENILQNRLRGTANIQMLIRYGVFMRDNKQEPLSLKTDTLTLAINRRMQKVRGNESGNTADAFMDKNKRLLEKVIEAVKSERSKKYFS